VSHRSSTFGSRIVFWAFIAVAVSIAVAACSSDAGICPCPPNAAKAVPDTTGSIAPPPAVSEPLPPPPPTRVAQVRTIPAARPHVRLTRPRQNSCKASARARLRRHRRTSDITGSVGGGTHWRSATAPRPVHRAGVPIVVARGDTVASLSRRYGVSELAIAAVNRLDNPPTIWAGQHLIIPR
jgi:nucleoid-associated protein YgaU